MVRAAEDAGVVFATNHHLRCSGSHRAVRGLIEAGRIGKVLSLRIFHAVHLPPHLQGWRINAAEAGGGVIPDITVHDADVTRFLLGEEVASVSAHAAVLVDPEIGEAGDYDSASVILETASGKQAIISNSRRATYGYDQRIEVHGSKGVVSAENQRAVSIEIANGDGYTRPPLHDFFMTRYTEAYANEIAAFISAIEKGTPISPSGADGLVALQLADAAVESVRTGKRVSVD